MEIIVKVLPYDLACRPRETRIVKDAISIRDIVRLMYIDGARAHVYIYTHL